MKRLGTLERIGQGRGLVAVEGDEPPSIGVTAVDETLTPIGTVVDIIGPVKEPWAVIDPEASIDLPAALGNRLYVRA